MMSYHLYEDHKDKVKFPCFVQPKLNGVRARAVRESDTVRLYSKLGNEFAVLQQHTKLVQELIDSMKVGDVWEGELYVHDWKLQDIVSAVKTYSELTHKVRYCIFDVVKYDVPYFQRIPELAIHRSAIDVLDPNICRDHSQIERLHAMYCKHGYEGTIIRDMNGMYSDTRVTGVLKYKKFYDTEFKIAGYKSCTKGGILFKCVTDSGEEFNVKPIGTVKQRQDMLAKAETYVGKMLTVRYLDLSKRGVPTILKGICVRDYE